MTPKGNWWGLGAWLTATLEPTSAKASSSTPTNANNSSRSFAANGPVGAASSGRSLTDWSISQAVGQEPDSETLCLEEDPMPRCSCVQRRDQIASHLTAFGAIRPLTRGTSRVPAASSFSDPRKYLPGAFDPPGMRGRNAYGADGADQELGLVPFREAAGARASPVAGDDARLSPRSPAAQQERGVPGRSADRRGDRCRHARSW